MDIAKDMRALALWRRAEPLIHKRVRFVAYCDDVHGGFLPGDILVCLGSAADAGVGQDAIRALRVADGEIGLVFPEELELIVGPLPRST